jgi:hypothetical protein
MDLIVDYQLRKYRLSRREIFEKLFQHSFEYLHVKDDQLKLEFVGKNRPFDDYFCPIHV